jgi:anaerobic magnesium-protoporphyrin IX monomethyl ester cyclase
MRIACIVPPLHFPVNEYGHGYLPPLGLLSLAGPLIDQGHKVTLIDADAGHLQIPEVIQRLHHAGTEIALVGHSGSMVANPNSLNLCKEIKRALPEIKMVYGGVYPSYASEEILSQFPEVDFIVRGEGEITVTELVSALQCDGRPFHDIEGLSWRRGKQIVTNPPRAPIQDLDQFRVAWELLDWNVYRNNHLPGRIALVQFSRGCPLSCTYCGQWKFWKKWRHRSIAKFVDELEFLETRCDVSMVWTADENWGEDPVLLHRLLSAIAERGLKLRIFCAMCAKDVVRDKEVLHLYKQAGIVCLMMGIESFNDDVLAKVNKANPGGITREAISLLRKNGILTVVNVIHGLKDESWRTILKTTLDLRRAGPDFYNALHLTPLSWTKEGRSVHLDQIIQLDQSRWDFRKPVIQSGRMSPFQQALAVKLSELLFYCRPLWILKQLLLRDPIQRRVALDGFPRLARVFLSECAMLFRLKFSNPGEASKDLRRLSLLLPGRITANELRAEALGTARE